MMALQSEVKNEDTNSRSSSSKASKCTHLLSKKEDIVILSCSATHFIQAKTSRGRVKRMDTGQEEKSSARDDLEPYSK